MIDPLSFENLIIGGNIIAAVIIMYVLVQLIRFAVKIKTPDNKITISNKRHGFCPTPPLYSNLRTKISTSPTDLSDDETVLYKNCVKIIKSGFEKQE